LASNTPRSSTKRSNSSARSSSRNGSGAKKKTTARKPAAATRGTRSTRSTSNASRASSNGSKRSTSTSTRSRSTASSNGNGNGVVDTVKSVAGKAAGPAVAVGAAAVGIAGGIALKTRTRRKTVLGVKMPRSFGKSLPDIDAKSIAKSVGQASRQFAKTSKGVSKDLERAGDQAERIGKILD
jgi:hypothetical protein